jgi:hypothetical protein
MGLVSISKNVGKLLGTTAKAIKKYKKTTLVGVGGLAVGTGGYVVGKTTGHTASGHGRRKIAADMTPKEKADQKYAIAMRYKEDGHPKKSSEYKSKAARAYKAAWEKKAFDYTKALKAKNIFSKKAPRWLADLGSKKTTTTAGLIGGALGGGAAGYMLKDDIKKSLKSSAEKL